MEKAGDLDELMVEEDRADSECCSGCQSGWTLYLDQSQQYQERLTNSVYWEEDEDEDEDEDEKEEDLSMVSDASSGPPHVHEEEDNIYSCCCDDGDGCLCNATFLPLPTVAKNGNKRRRAEEEQQENQDSFLDDTASSTLFAFSKTTMSGSCSSKKLLMEDDHSCCFSATHFKVPLEQLLIAFSAFFASFFFCRFAGKKVKETALKKSKEDVYKSSRSLHGLF